MSIFSGIFKSGVKRVLPKVKTIISPDILNRAKGFPSLKRTDIQVKNYKTGNFSKPNINPVDVNVNSQEAIYSGRLSKLSQEKPYAVEQLKYVQDSLDKLSTKDLGEVAPLVNRAIDNLNEFDIKKSWDAVNSKNISEELSKSFTEATDGFNFGNALAKVKALITGAEQSSINLSLIYENRLVVGLREMGPKHTEAFNILLNNPEKFKGLHNVSQEDIFIELIENSGRFKDVPFVGNIIKLLNKTDSDNIDALQKAGVPIGKRKGFSLGLQIPNSFAHNNTLDEFLQTFKDNTKISDYAPLELLYNILTTKSSLDEVGDNINFLARKLQFHSARHELNFYQKVNGIQEGGHLLQDIINFKKKTIKQAMIRGSLGATPIQTFKESINKVKTSKYGAKLNIKNRAELDKIEGWFAKHYNALGGGVNVTNQTLENIGDIVSSLTSATTGALGGSFVRNALFDFVSNYNAVKQAIYNPTTTIGAAAFETLKSFADVAATYRATSSGRKAVGKFLDSMQVAAVSDSIGISNINTIENAFEAVGLSSGPQSATAKIAATIRKGHSKVFSLTGSDQLLDNRRATHLIKLQRFWANTLDNVSSYDEYLSNFVDPIDKKQVAFLKTKFGIGKKEFNLLKKVGRYKTEGKVLGLKVPDAITPDSILSSTGIASKRELQDLSHKWRVFMYNSIVNAAPVTTNADSISISSGIFNASSALRLVMRPIFKFSDISQTQFNTVVNRVALSSYGNRATAYTANSYKSHYSYAKALLYYTGGNIGVSWAKDLLQGRDFTDYTNIENVKNSAIFSGFGGMPLQTLTSVFSSNRGGSGFYGNLPVSKLLRDTKKVSEIVTEGYLEGDKIKLYKGLQALSGFTGISSLWYAKGVINSGFKHAILSKPDIDQVTKDENAYRFPSKDKASPGGFRN